MKYKKPLLAAGALLGVAALLPGLLQGKSIGDIPAGTGYSALDLCSRTMVSGEPAAHVQSQYIEPKVGPLPWLWQVEIVPKQRVSVRTWLPFLNHPRTAVYREGLGCTVVPPGSTEATVRAQPFRSVAAPPAQPGAWPFGEGAAESALLEASTHALIERHAERIFGDPAQDPKRRRNATVLLVARDGHLVFERYAQHHGREQPQLGWSMTKTLTALIAGTLAREGKLELDAPVGLQRWQGTPKAAITWRQLLNMAPGLDWFEGYGGASDATEMLFSQVDQGAWAADRHLGAKPGEVFNYSTGFTNIAMLRMRELLGGTHQAIYDHYQTKLFAPLGMRGGVIEPDASGTPVGGARGMLRPVDWLRLGQLVLDGGRWNGAPLLAPDWVSFMTAASPASDGYGGSMWRQPTEHIDADVRPRLPKDLVFFAGHMSQFLIVVPSRRLLVLRMGVDHVATSEEDPTLQEVLELVIELSKT